MLVALLLDSGFRRNDELKAASELSGKADSGQGPVETDPFPTPAQLFNGSLAGGGAGVA
jgi:hypothetical protein